MTKVEWTHRPGTVPVAWNPVTGCTPISPGCAHCYARRMAKRLAGRCGYPESPHEFDVTLHPDKLDEPATWKKPRTIFVCSMGDLFHEDVPFEYTDRVFSVMGMNQRHTFIVLTKRAERMADYYHRIETMPDWMPNNPACVSTWSPPNIWLGVTAGNQEMANKRIPALLSVPAAVHFVSIEPMLGPVDLSRWLPAVFTEGSELAEMNEMDAKCPGWDTAPVLSWVIAGGETGPGARPMHPGWVRSVRNQCQSAGVPYFFKSWGDWAEWHSGRPGTPWSDNVISVDKSGIRQAVLNSRPDDALMQRVGKKAAGDLLDGVQYHEWPEVGQ